MIEKTLRSYTANCFEVKVAYEKEQEDGKQKTVIELYVVEAYSFSEAEETIIKEMSAYVIGDIEVKSITPAKYHEVFFSEDEGANKWFKAKLEFISIDEKTEKEKRNKVFYLVHGNTIDDANNIIKSIMDSTIIDYIISSVSETKIMDLFVNEAKRDKE